MLLTAILKTLGIIVGCFLVHEFRERFLKPKEPKKDEPIDHLINYLPNHIKTITMLRSKADIKANIAAEKAKLKALKQEKVTEYKQYKVVPVHISEHWKNRLQSQLSQIVRFQTELSKL